MKTDMEYANNLHDQIERIRLQDITAIENIISVLSKKIRDRGTGHIHTAISVLTWRIEQIEKGEEVHA